MLNQKLANLLKQKNTFVFFLILLSLMVGLFWVIQAWSNPLESDEGVYYKIGQNLCQLNKFAIPYQDYQISTMSRPPLYPFLISVFYCLGAENPNFIRVFQIFLFIGIAILAYLNAKLIFNEKIARLSSLLVALYPPIGFLTGQLHTEITFIFLSLCASLFLVLLFKNKKNSYAIWSGIFFGLATLTRPVFFLFPVFLIIVLLSIKRYKLTLLKSSKNFLTGQADLLKKSLILLLFFALTISPWLIRNYLIFKEVNISNVSSLAFYTRAYQIHYYSSQEIKHWILLSLFGSYLTKKIDSGYDYYFSKFEPHVYRRGSTFPAEFGPKWPTDLTLDEGRKKLLEEAKPLIIQHPIKLSGFTFLEFFRIHQPLLIEFGDTDLFAGTHPEIDDWLKTSIIIFIKLAYLLFFIIVFYGIIVGFRKFNLTLPVLIIIAYIILLLCAVGTLPRYTIPLYPFYFMFFSFIIIRFFDKFIRKTKVNY